MLILRNPGTDGGEVIAEAPDVVSHTVAAGGWVAELRHDFRPGEGLIDFHRGGLVDSGKRDHMKQVIVFSDGAKNPPDLLHLAPGSFLAPELGQDLAPGSHLDGALVEVAAGLDHGPVRTDDRCVRLILIQVPGQPRRPVECVAEAGEVPCGD